MYQLLRVVLILTTLLAACAAASVILAAPIILVAFVGIGIWTMAVRVRSSSAHGTARWADLDDIPHMLGGNGLILGRMSGRPSKARALRSLVGSSTPPQLACQSVLAAFQHRPANPFVRLNNVVHTAVFAPTGVGKGVSVVIPYLLTCPDSMVVVDFKSENYKLTANARRKMGHRIVILDPYRIATREPDTFNPLEFIDPDSPTALDDCRDLAEALVVRTGQEHDEHWLDAAEIWITAMMATVVVLAKGPDKSLQSVRTMLTDPEKMQAAITFMCQSDAMDGMLARLGHQLAHFKEKELSSCLTTTNRFLRFLDTIAIAENTTRSTFDPVDLLTGKVTVYLVLPPDRARAQTPLLRMWIGSLLRAVVKGGLQETNKVHFVLDEAAALGQMNALDDAVDKFRGFGVRLIFLYQSLGQLKKCFPDGQDQTLLGNVTQVFFGVNDPQTAEYVSSRLGETTITTESGGTSQSRSTQQSHQGDTTSYSTSSNQNWQYMGRKLLKPEEVTALPERIAITFTPGVPPIATRLVRYYEKDFQRLSGAGPLRTAFQTACLCIPIVVIAVVVIACALSHVLSY